MDSGAFHERLPITKQNVIMEGVFDCEGVEMNHHPLAYIN